MKFTPLLAAGFIGVSLATSSFAAGSDDSTPPKPTETTRECKKGKVWDKKKKKCVEASYGMFDDDFIYVNARELAYDGQFQHAIRLLHLAENPNDPRILNYLGFTNRKAGNTQIAMAYYKKALAINPDYILARSYMGQALVLADDMDGARQQLAEIGNRGGKGTWAYRALKQSIAGSGTY